MANTYHNSNDAYSFNNNEYFLFIEDISIEPISLSPISTAIMKKCLEDINYFYILEGPWFFIKISTNQKYIEYLQYNLQSNKPRIILIYEKSAYRIASKMQDGFGDLIPIVINCAKKKINYTKEEIWNLFRKYYPNEKVSYYH
jgi:hypothetical protein